jgi:hypothetical protein
MDDLTPDTLPNSQSLVDMACALEAHRIYTLVAMGALPANIWAFIRVIEVWNRPDQVMIWAIVASPN